MSKNRIITFALAAAVGLVVGSWFGLSAGRTLGRFSAEMEGMSSDAQLGRFSALQSAHADAFHARDAALLTIDIVTKIQQAEPDLPRSSSWALAYGRLAIAGAQLGDKEAARKALDVTRQLLHRPSHRDLTDEEAKQWVRKLDASFQNLP